MLHRFIIHCNRNCPYIFPFLKNPGVIIHSYISSVLHIGVTRLYQLWEGTDYFTKRHWKQNHHKKWITSKMYKFKEHVLVPSKWLCSENIVFLPTHTALNSFFQNLYIFISCAQARQLRKGKHLWHWII